MPRESRQDNSRVGVEERSELVTLTREEYESLMAMADTPPPNPHPAVEEGPHLKKPEVAEAKREQLREFGVVGDEDWLTDDMKSVLGGD